MEIRLGSRGHLRRDRYMFFLSISEKTESLISIFSVCERVSDSMLFISQRATNLLLRIMLLLLRAPR